MPNELLQQLSQWFGNLSVFDQVVIPLLFVPALALAARFGHEIHKACTNGIPHIQAAQEEHLRVAVESRDNAKEFYKWMKGNEAGKQSRTGTVATSLIEADNRRERGTDHVADRLEG